jgi:hypothetical protein
MNKIKHINKQKLLFFALLFTAQANVYEKISANISDWMYPAAGVAVLGVAASVHDFFYQKR